MKSTLFALLAGSSFAFTGALQGQGTFQNLDFEGALISPSQPSGSAVSPGIAFPGWSAYIGTNQTASVVYNNIALSAANISIVGTNGNIVQAIEGRFSAYLQGSAHDNNANIFEPWEVSLRQTGLVPATAQALTFISGLTDPYSSISVSLGGQGLSLILLQATPGYTLYGADVSPFAGQLTELRFTARANYPHPIGYPEMNAWLLDSISFSDQPIPEPGAITLFCLGVLLLNWQSRSSSGRKQKPGGRQVPPGE